MILHAHECSRHVYCGQTEDDQHVHHVTEYLKLLLMSENEITIQ